MPCQETVLSLLGDAWLIYKDEEKAPLAPSLLYVLSGRDSDSLRTVRVYWVAESKAA